MSSGLLGWLGFGKQNKVNQAQNYLAPPSASSAPNYQSLNDLAKQRIQAGITGAETPGVGYGKDFVDKATNPAIANIDYNFQNRTMPLISSELSKRGVARSAGQGLATDVIGRADQQRNLDVNDLISKFYTLNEAQKKTDITQGIDVGKTQDANYLNQGNNQSTAYNAAEAGNTARTAGVAATQNAADRARQNQTLQSVGSLISTIMPGATSGGPVMLPDGNSTYGANNIPQGFGGRPNPGGGVSGVATNIAGNQNAIQQLLALFGV